MFLGRRRASLATQKNNNPVPLAHLNQKELEIAIAAGAVRNGEMSPTAFQIAYGVRWKDAEHDLVSKGNDRADAACVHPTDGENLTDDGNSLRFARQNGGVIRYCHQRGLWLVWNGKRWQWDQSGISISLAKKTVRSIYGECEREPDKKRRDALGDHARRSENDARIRAMLHLAQPEVPVQLEELDRQRFLFNCQNGVIDLRTGALMPHDAELILTKISPVEYNPHARCNRFLAFLDEVMESNKALIDFLQLWFGYSLTADVREHVVAFFHGQGSNGKSTLLDIIVYVMGHYATVAAPGLLMMKRNEQHTTEIADLAGQRLVAVIETQEGRRFNESILKWLSGGDRVKARYMREDFFEFQATHKFTMAANHRPVVSDNTESFWRRLKLVPFNVQIPKESRDKGLGEKLKEEADGILAWAVQGAVRWRQHGLPEPPEITAATDDYRDEQDFLAPFIAEHCEIANSKDEEVQVGELYERYTKWAGDSGEKPVSRKRLSAMLKERGFENEPRGGKTWWKGLTLKP
jgi:putative DNA primase/helicase